MPNHEPNGEPNSVMLPAATARRVLREMRRAQTLEQEGRVEEAVATLESAMQMGADRYTCYLRLARLYQRRHQWTEAVAAAELAIAEHPDKLSAREAVIALYLEVRDYERAVDASIALLKLSPHHVPARDALGTAYIGLGNVDAAIRVANDLVRLDPSDASHRFKKALLCQHRGEVRTAVEEFERVLAMAPDSDLAETAREQLDSLDVFQIDTILLLAEQDAVFRMKLLRDSHYAAAERGFALSESGRQKLEELVSEAMQNPLPDAHRNLYH